MSSIRATVQGWWWNYWAEILLGSATVAIVVIRTIVVGGAR